MQKVTRGGQFRLSGRNADVCAVLDDLLTTIPSTCKMVDVIQLLRPELVTDLIKQNYNVRVDINQ